MKKMVALLLTFCMLFTMSTVAFASEVNHHRCDNVATLRVVEGDVIEKSEIRDPKDGSKITTIRKIHPDGTVDFTVEQKGEVISGNSAKKEDYSYYYNLATNQTSLPYGSEVEGKHYYYTTFTDTVENTTLSRLITYALQGVATSKMVAVLVAAGVASPAAGLVATMICGFVAGELVNSPDKMVIEQSNYEVRAEWDNDVYICHCAHVYTQIYDEYDNLLEEETDYYQAIGGI